MADAPIVKSRRVTRDKLAAIFKSHELIKAFENLIDDVSVAIPAAVGAEADNADTVLKAASFSRQPAPAPSMNNDTVDIMAAQLFARQVPTPAVPSDTASAILASQIFGA